MSDIQYLYTNELVSGVRNLAKRGGNFGRAASRVNEIIGAIASEESDPLKGLQQTNHGEGRIKSCIKYDLPGRTRLVTVQHTKKCILLYAGTHDDVDKWLDSNRGAEFRADASNRVRAIRTGASVVAERFARKELRAGLPGALYGHLHTDLYDQLSEGLGNLVKKSLERLESLDYQDLEEVCEEIENAAQQEAVRDTFLLLLGDRIADAETRIRDYLQEFVELDEIEMLASSDRFSVVPRNDPEYVRTFRRLITSENYKSWMLFMHPEQERVAVEQFDGPAKLIGVSGSGKTCVVVRRALELAARYPDERILVLTLNPPLASLIRELVVEAGGQESLDRIRVDPLFSICQEILHQHEPENDKLYNEETWKAKEHVDEVWREYYRCEVRNDDAECLLPVHDSLLARGIDAEKYIRQEFDWIRSAFPLGRRKEYLLAERRGRTYPLSLKFRKHILDGLSGWERKLSAVGVTDYLGVASAAHRYIDRIKPQYRCVIVDECQDFGTTELSIVRRIVPRGTNDLFLCGDAAQQVSSKFQSVQAAGIATHATRSRELILNYRNSKDILNAAFELLMNNLAEAFWENTDFEILDPSYADFSGPTPDILEAETLEQEIANAIVYIRQLHDGDQERKALIAIAGLTNLEVARYGSSDAVGIPVLSPDRKFSDSDIYLSDLEQSKGFEFDTVCIVNCKKGVLPDSRIPEDERFRDLARFYVTMTRAKVNLVISWSGCKSEYLEGAEEHFTEGTWREILDEIPDPMPLPQRLSEIRVRHEDEIPIPLQSARQFLYQQHAIGFPSQVIEQVRKYVTGQGRTQGPRKERIAWKDIGTAYRDLKQQPAARQRFGPETSEFLLENLAPLMDDKGNL